LSATGCRGVEAMPNSGGNSSYCGRSSLIRYHFAFDATNMCLVGFRPRSPSRLPAGAITSPAASSISGATEPHTVQNSRWPRSEDW
jgi:hypothetical protein